MIVIDEKLFPPDIDTIKTIRVAIATDQNGKQGVMTIHEIMDGILMHTPCVWSDDKRDHKFREIVEHAKRHNPNIKVEIKEFEAR